MSRALSVFTATVLSLLVVALAACGGGGEEKATQTPAKPTGATATEAAASTPVGARFSGSATATVKVGDKTFTFKNGKCDTAPDGSWLAVNIGQAASDEYFGLLVGANPSAPGGAKPVSGGGVFTDGEIAFSGTQGGTTFIMGGIGEAAQANKVTVAADLKSGEFEGNTLDGQPISGSFQCS
jgi:hypothetical protein